MGLIIGSLIAAAGALALAATAKVDEDDPTTKIAEIAADSVILGANTYKKVTATSKGKSYQGYAKQTELEQIPVETVSIPASFAGLEAEMVPTRLEEQLFRIVEVVDGEGYVTITARHVWYDNLSNQTWWKADNDTRYSAGAVCRNVLEHTVSPVPSHVATDCTDEIIGKDLDYERKNLVEAFLDPEKGICAKYGLSMIRYNWDFYCLKDVGYNRGIVIQNGKNLLGVERRESIENVVTRIAPIAKDKDGNIVWMNVNGAWYVDSEHINDYAFPRSIIYDTGLKIGTDDVTEENVQEKLVAAANKQFTEDKVDLPEVEMKIEFLSLGDTEEYAQYRNLDKVYLYDILTIIDTERGYSYTAQVVAVEHDLLTGMLNSVTIGKLDNWDGKRKIATWQVPEIDGANIRLKSIMAGAFAEGAIYGSDLAESIIEYAHFKTATIEALTADSIDAVTARIHEIIAGSITADDIQTGSLTAQVIAAGAITTDKLAAGAITTEKLDAEAVTAAKIAAGAITTAKLDAYAITADKIAADAVTAEKIKAGSINADHIDTTELSAINAKLGTADIADARIALADIGFAQIKDLNAQSAYFGQAVFEEAVGGKLYVPRLAVGYAQMLGATISDLVIQASNDNFYKLDVDLAGNVTATQMTPTAAEIAQGYTEDGRTIYMGTDILATDLNTQNIYASHGLMDEITANIINVDKLFAREATITKINALDLSSNSYIAATIGTWTSGSTITQTINSLVSHVQQMGYANIYYSATEPDHNNLVEGDIWIQPQDENSWSDILNNTWNYLNNNLTWEEVYGAYTMYAWNGTTWRKMYDSTVTRDLSTQIEQNTQAIALKANQTDVSLISGEVSAFAAQLEVQAQAIQSAVSSVNAKTALYVQWTDPANDYTLTIGDQWVKSQDIFKKWKQSSDAPTWQTVKGYKWEDALGDKTYVWSGTDWVLTADRAMELYHNTQILQTAEAIALEAQARLAVEDLLYQLGARLVVTNTSIQQEVWRATNAEGGKIDKTSRLQTADAIVQEAVSQSAAIGGESFILKTTIYQDAQSIVNEAVAESASAASGIYLAKTSTYQTADSIVTEAVRQATQNGNSNYIKKTTQYQSADEIYSSAVSASGAAALSLAQAAEQNAKNDSVQKDSNHGYNTIQDILDKATEIAENAADDAETGAVNQCIKRTSVYQTASSIVAAAEQYTDDNAYGIVSGIIIAAVGVDITGNKHINLDVNANNYVHINENGIDVKGNRIKVNGKYVFDREDIIIMNPNAPQSESWRRTVAGIESHQNGAHDWVLIRPYYDAKLVYNLPEDYTAQASSIGSTPKQLIQEGGLGGSFGASSTYRYVFRCTVPIQSFISLGITLTLSDNPNLVGNVITSTQTATVSTTEPANITFQMTSPINLCTETSAIWFKLECDGKNVGGIGNITLECYCDSTTSRVPCTTYYYP